MVSGFLCEPRDICVNPEGKSSNLFFCDHTDICVNPKESSSGFFVSPGICVNSEGKSSNLFLCDLRGILCESEREELGVRCDPRDIFVNPKEGRRDSSVSVSSGGRGRARVDVWALG